MKECQPYLQQDCNLAYISKLTQVPVHHLAYYFRQERKQPFNDFRNEWRIGHAKTLISEGKTREMTLEAIGLLSGFSTRNTFFTSFKKVEGVAPSIFASKFAE
jgi:AraC-like DNA-binding protein